MVRGGNSPIAAILRCGWLWTLGDVLMERGYFARAASTFAQAALCDETVKALGVGEVAQLALQYNECMANVLQKKPDEQALMRSSKS